ncbi:MAG: NAD(P)H:quinone oxidoreductase [bacterium]
MKVLVLYYSMYGHVFKLAQAVAEGVRAVDGVEGVLKQVPDLLPQEVVEKTPGVKEAKEAQRDVEVARPEELGDYEAIVLGSPTRYGNMCAQVENFIDQTGPLWAKGALIGKVGGVFTSTASLHGGQETTLFSMFKPLLHHGMIVVGIPYSEQRLLTTTGGGTPYGASTVAGMEGEKEPSADELAMAKTLGQRVAQVAKELGAGREVVQK